MKTPVSKFALIAFVALLALSGIKADSRLFCDSASQEVAQGELRMEEEIISMAEKKFNKRQSSEDENEGFTFPNVFDALRSIF